MRVGSLFSGIGGFDLGLERAGMRVAWQCEANPYRRAVLRHHWPDAPCFEDVRCLTGSNGSSSSAEGSPAPTSPSLARGLDSMASSRVFGERCSEWFASFDLATSSWRTSQLSLLEDSDGFSGTWPRAGMTRSGTAFRLRPLAPLTDEIAFGSLPTPSRTSYGYNQQDSPGAVVRPSLETMARQAMWPTPKASPSGPDFARADRKGSGGDDLATAVARWPTPRRTDADRGGRAGWVTENADAVLVGIQEAVAREPADTGTGGGPGRPMSDRADQHFVKPSPDWFREWPRFRKRYLTQAIRIDGPFSVETQRHPLKASSSSLARSSGLKRGKGPKRHRKPAMSDEERRQAALWRWGIEQRGECVMPGPHEGPLHAHHVLTQQVLRQHGHADKLWLGPNGIALCERHHTRHHRAVQRVPKGRLPAEAIMFAQRLGLGWYVDRYYTTEEAA